jgi:thioredoxin reductase (NADPH)
MSSTTQPQYDLIIIGSGPAGLTAAIYTSRATINTLIIAGNPPGGQLTTTTEVENFPGFSRGIEGPTLIAEMRTQAEKFGTTLVDENVTAISGNVDTSFTLETDAGNSYTAKAVIVSTGATAKWLGLESETRLRGKGVSACATCDGFFFKDKVIAVVGGGDAAMEEATFLTKFASKVYVLIRGTQEKLKASKFMQEKAQANAKIEFMFNTEVKEVLGDTSVSGLRILNNKTQKETTLDNVQGLFVAIGHKPATQFLEGFVELDKGYIKVSEGTKTSKEGVFAGGDCVDYKYRQAITAAGFGCMASLDAERYLSHKLA